MAICDDPSVMSQRATRIIVVVLALAGVLLGVLAYQVQVDNLPEPLTTPLRAAAGVVAAWSFLLAGLVAWSRRPDNRLGPLMVATCFALLARQFRYSHDPLAFTVFLLIGELGYVMYTHVALANPSGRVTDRIERMFLVIAYALALAFPFVILLAYDATERLRYFDPFPRESLLLASGNADLVAFVQDAHGTIGYGALACVFIALVVRRFARGQRGPAGCSRRSSSRR